MTQNEFIFVGNQCINLNHIIRFYLKEEGKGSSIIFETTTPTATDSSINYLKPHRFGILLNNKNEYETFCLKFRQAKNIENC